MRGKITEKQKYLLEAIHRSFLNEGFPPSFDELKDVMNVKSNQSIIDHLVALEKKGFIKREKGSARGIKILPLGFATLGADPIAPVAGTSYGGAFADTFQLTGTWQELSSEVKQLSDQVYIIEVSGDSMINAGIFDGDQLLIKAQEHFKSGDIVVAASPSGTTVKRFIRQNKPPFIFLKPENPKYKHISFTEEVNMQGKVVSKLNNGQWQPLIQGRFL